MSSHKTCGHENTKAARAKCRATERKLREGTPLPKMSAERKAKEKARSKPKADTEKAGVILTQPHEFVPLDHRPSMCKHCGQTERGRLHDGVTGESRLHTAQAACKHPAKDHVLKGSTRKKAGAWYCKCGKFIADEGPKDLSARFNFGTRR